MKKKRIAHIKIYQLIGCSLLALSLGLIAIPSYSSEVHYPDSYEDIASSTANPENVSNDGGCATIQSSVDAGPSIIYVWDLSGTECLTTISVKGIPQNFIDDSLEMEYSIDNGVTWHYLLDNTKFSNSENYIYDYQFDSTDTVIDLRVRINTDRIKGPDGAFLDLYYIKAGLETCTEPPSPPGPTITQSAFSVYEDIGAADFYAVTQKNIGGDARARTIAIDAYHMYVAGQVPLGTARGWRIEKRNLADGLLDASEQIENGGEPNSIVLSGESIYVVGDALEDGQKKWHIEKLDLNLDRDTEAVFDIDNFYGTAYAAVIAGDTLFITGSDYSLGDAQWRVEKRSFEGTLINYSINNPGNDTDIPLAMVADDTYLYIGGYTKNTIGKNRKAITTVESLLEKRRLDNLAIESSINSDYPSETIDQVTALSIYKGALYAARVREVGFWDTIGSIEKFDTANLIKDSNFVFQQNYGYDDRTLALAVGQDCWYDGNDGNDGRDCLIAAGFSSDAGSGGDTAWRADVLDIESPHLEYSVLLDINSHNNDRIYAVAVDNAHMYLAGYQNPGLPQWHIQKRRLSDGSLGAWLPNNVLDNGNSFRYQALLDVETAPLAPNDASFSLKYCLCESSPVSCGSCSGETTVTKDSVAISFNPKGWDGMQALIGAPENDDTFMGYDIRYQTIVDEVAYFTNSTSINPGESGLWDFQLKANQPGTYCLRIFDSESQLLGDCENNQIIINPLD